MASKRPQMTTDELSGLNNPCSSAFLAPICFWTIDLIKFPRFSYSHYLFNKVSQVFQLPSPSIPRFCVRMTRRLVVHYVPTRKNIRIWTVDATIDGLRLKGSTCSRSSWVKLSGYTLTWGLEENWSRSPSSPKSPTICHLSHSSFQDNLTLSIHSFLKFLHFTVLDSSHSKPGR